MPPSRNHAAGDALTERMRRAINLHCDPAAGSAFWIDRAARLGFDPRRRSYGLQDLHLLGETTAEDLRGRPLRDFVPRRFHGRLDRFIVGQTGGATGEGVWTAYRQDEFEEAFVFPFVEAAGVAGFPAKATWLFVGPSGPHIIGKVVRCLANALGSADPFSVDFDPRWARKLPDGSFARGRYVQHVIDQAMSVIERQGVEVLFTTPAVLDRLAAAMTDVQRSRIAGVHYGGMEVTPEFLLRMQTEAFPSAVHLSGYGNTLFGCCLELDTQAGRQLDYYPYGDRLHLEVVDERGQALPTGCSGRVRFSRFDETMLIVRMLERDEGILVTPPAGAPESFHLPGIRNPHMPPRDEKRLTLGLY
ncbi:MAG: hypothetical protein HY718_02840 [Planctomycetes bacterium]|nr:hypothetical protein [Planctomycetota bacterium]